MKEIFIHGFKTKYEENAKEGMKYLLYDLDREEARVFFDQARLRKRAKFEDDQDRQFTLIYNQDGTYTLLRR
jgi:hypothetical protein